MNLILDTHALLWFLAGDPRLSKTARTTIEHAKTTSYVSLASWWEMSIKCSLGKLRVEGSLDTLLQECLDQGFHLLPIETNHILPLVKLPFHHRDPFDRLLVCQAIAEKMPVCSSDSIFSAYPIKRIW